MKLISRGVNSTSFPAFILFAVMFIINVFITTGFLSVSFQNGFFASNASLICIAIGMSMVIITGGIDLSVGAIVCLCNVTMVSLAGAGWGLLPIILVGMLIATGGGALNGILVAILRINPMMATFATQSMFAGLALWIMSVPGGVAPQALVTWFSVKIGGMIPMSLVMILILLFVVIIIMRMPIGVSLYAIGNNEECAFISGIKVTRIKFFTYVFAGIASGLAAICYTARTGGGDPTAGLTLTLNAIAACVIGGLSLTGGKGTCVGGFWGALFLQLIITTVLAAKISTMAQDLIQGLIILIGMIATIVFFSRTKKERRLISK